MVWSKYSVSEIPGFSLRSPHWLEYPYSHLGWLQKQIWQPGDWEARRRHATKETRDLALPQWVGCLGQSSEICHLSPPPQLLLLPKNPLQPKVSGLVLPSGHLGHHTQACYPQGVSSSESPLDTYLQGIREPQSASLQIENNLFTNSHWWTTNFKITEGF